MPRSLGARPRYGVGRGELVALRVACAAAGGLALALLGPLVPEADAKVFHSQEEALELAFPDADRIDSQTYILTGSQKQAIVKLARSDLESELVTLFSGWRDGALLGHALIDVHTVRTQPEAFMVVLTPEGEVRSLQVLAFHEPPDSVNVKNVTSPSVPSNVIKSTSDGLTIVPGTNSPGTIVSSIAVPTGESSSMPRT